MYSVPLCLLLLYLIFIEGQNRRYRKSFDLVIHVNGIRGKSTIVRMLDAVFREHGYTTFSKVTGTYPKIIDCHGQEKDIKRNLVTILEQRKTMKEAHKQGAKVLIIECMALKLESQIYSRKLLKSDISVISNVRTDHLEVMGLTHNDILKHLSASIGEELTITSDSFVYEGLKAMTKNVQLAKESPKIKGEHVENTAVVFEIGHHLGLNQNRILKALENYRKDTCVSRVISWEKIRLFNGFSANDYESTKDLYRLYLEMKQSEETDLPLVLWFNDRHDRPIRSKLFIKWLLHIQPKAIILTGDRQSYNKTQLKKGGFKGDFVDTARLENNQLVFGFGNIKGLDFYEE